MSDHVQIAAWILLAAAVSIGALFLANPNIRDAVVGAVLQIF